jgi:ribose transport system permease protein
VSATSSVRPRRGRGASAVDSIRGQLTRSGAVVVSLLVLAVLAVLIEMLRPGSFTLDRLGLKSGEVLTLALVATGETIVVLRGGIDLSVGGTLSLATALAATRGADSGMALPWLLIIPLVGVVVGLGNAVVISTLRLQPFLVTLATWSIVEGTALLVLPVEGGSVPSGWFEAIQGSVAGVPVPVIVIVALMLWWLWFRGTRPMQRVRAAGSSERAAFLGGVSPLRANLVAYGLAGLFAALAGMYYAGQTGSGSPTVGSQYLLPAIAAVVIGGTSLLGGRGGLLGTLVGVVILNFIGDIVFLLHLPSYWQPVATGVILVLVVVANSLVSSISARNSGAEP